MLPRATAQDNCHFSDPHRRVASRRQLGYGSGDGTGARAVFTFVFMTRGCRGAEDTRGSRQRTIAAALVTAVAVLSACSFDYSDAGVSAEQLRDNVPETDLTDVTHTIVRNGRVVAEITAQRVQNYRNRGLTILNEVRYTEYDRAGNPVTTGTAERAVYYPESRDAQVSGAVQLRSEVQEVWLRADLLSWEDERRRLSAPQERMVEILRDDGSQVVGGGLDVDVRRKTIRLESVTGTLVTDSARE